MPFRVLKIQIIEDLTPHALIDRSTEMSFHFAAIFILLKYCFNELFTLFVPEVKKSAPTQKVPALHNFKVLAHIENNVVPITIFVPLK